MQATQANLTSELESLTIDELAALVAKVARKNQEAIEKQAARYERQSYKAYDEKGEEAYNELQELADDANQDAREWDELAAAIEGFRR